MEERLNQVEDAVGAISALLLDYICAMEESGYNDSMEFVKLRNRAQRLVLEYLDSVTARSTEKFLDKEEGENKMNIKEVKREATLGYADFALMVQDAKNVIERERKLEQLGVNIEYLSLGEMLELFLRKFRDSEDVSGWFWDEVYDGASAESMWATLIDDEQWF